MTTPVPDDQPLGWSVLTPAQRESVKHYQALAVPCTWFIGPRASTGTVEVVALGEGFAWSFLIEPDGTDHSSEAKLGEFSTGITV